MVAQCWQVVALSSDLRDVRGTSFASGTSPTLTTFILSTGYHRFILRLHYFKMVACQDRAVKM